MVTRTRLALSLCIGIALVVAGFAQSQQSTPDPGKAAPSAAGARGRGPSPNAKVRRPPFPNGRLPQEILANISYGIKQMRMDEAPGLGALGGPLVAGRILDVKSDVVDDYYVVELVATNGQPLADVAIGKNGVVMSVWQYQPGAPRPLAPDLDDVKVRLTRRFGSADARYYHTMTNIEVSGGSVYVPLVAADTPRGRVYVNSSLDMFVEESFKPFTRSKEQEFEEFKKTKPEHFRATKTGVGTLRKLGKL
jgi:hypothetical protein